MSRSSIVKGVAGIFAVLVLVGCGLGKSEDAASAPGAFRDIDGNVDSDGDVTNGDPSTDPTVFPSDEAIKLAPPQVAQNFVLIPNPSHNRVTRVNTQSLEIDSIDVGGYPTQIHTLLDETWAVTLDRDSDTATAIDLSSSETHSIALRKHMNDIAVDTRTGWGIGFVNTELWQGSEGSEVKNIAEMSIFNVKTQEAQLQSVGERIRGIRFAKTGDPIAVVVTATQIFRIDMRTGSKELFSVPANIIELILLDDATRLVMRVQPTESSAATEIRVLNFADGSVITYPYDTSPTDIDYPNVGDAIWGIRPSPVTTSTETIMFRLDVVSGQLRTANIPGHFKRVSLDIGAKRGVLFNPDKLGREVAAIKFGSFPTVVSRSVTVVKPISDAKIAPGADTFILVHEDCICTDIDPLFDAEPTVSLLSFVSDILTPIRVNKTSGAWSFQGNGRFAYHLSDNADDVLIFDLKLQLPLNIEPQSSPMFIGSLPLLDANTELGRMYISQNHPLGRLSVITIEGVSGDFEYSERTVTGFELNGAIE